MLSDYVVRTNVGARRALVIAVHIGLWTAALWLAFLLRFDFRVPVAHLDLLSVWLPVLLAVRTAAFYHWGLFRGMWRYTGASDLTGIIKATTIGSMVTAAFLVLVLGRFARSILVIDWLAALTLVGGLRFGIRWLRKREGLLGAATAQRILVIGAGDAGEMLLREIHQRHAARFTPVGLLDDDPLKRGSQIHGVRVLGAVDDLPRAVASTEAVEVVIAIPTASGRQMRRIVDLCKAARVRFRTIPGMDELIDGRAQVSQLRDVAIEDLLGREPVRLDMHVVSSAMHGRVVLVSGAGGSIGSEICRQVCRFEPEALLLVERTENALFHVHRELRAAFPGVPLVPCIADVGDASRIEEVFRKHRPNVVFHAAAHKHVPMMEWNPGEAVKNNVLGTKTLADAAHAHGVERFVMISTDKAVNPTSVMGASKRVAEIYVQALSSRSRTRFVTVRFGNVLGSAGSVIPIFKEQIASGGPVTVTHPDMKRYFMTIPEASQLVLQAGMMGEGGEIFILDMGEPVKIADLARDLILLSGLKPDEDIEIRYTGVRPGEKLFEELSVASEHADRTGHPKIFVGRFRPHGWESVQRHIADLAAIADRRAAELRAKLREIVPEYRSVPVPVASQPAGTALKPVPAAMPVEVQPAPVAPAAMRAANV
jgi:FlaA1/EpsC-like NDP-sugar epimerase